MLEETMKKQSISEVWEAANGKIETETSAQKSKSKKKKKKRSMISNLRERPSLKTAEFLLIFYKNFANFAKWC